jgi:hypothetical protein
MSTESRILWQFFFCFWKEKKVKKYGHDDALTTSASALLDHGAEVFTKKMFRHTQSRAQERWINMKKSWQEKSRSPAGTSLTGSSSGPVKATPADRTRCAETAH